MKLLVLAGGFGTRLQSVVSDVPKALAPINGIPFLEFQIENWLNQGVDSFIFLLHYQASMVIEFLKKERQRLFKECEVNWIVEPAPLGTGGAIAFAVDKLAICGEFLATNADTWLGTGLQDIWLNDAPSLAVVKVNDVGRYGALKCTENGFITSFQEKSKSSGAGLINAGVSHLNPELFNDWNGKPFSIENIFYRDWVERKILKAVLLETTFIDIGIPSDYFNFCRWINAKKVGPLWI